MDVGRAIAELDARDFPDVARFDSSAPLCGHVAVLPSAFNPPTLAHFRLIEVGIATAGATCGAALLTTRNVAKEVDGSPLEHRVGMLTAATHHAVLVGNSARFVDQAAALRRAYPSPTIDFVVGYDTLVRIFQARYYADMPGELEPFFAAHRVVATNRAEHGLDEVERYLAGNSLARRFRDRILLAEVDADAAHLSSTNARERTGRGHDAMGVPPEVAEYIRRHRLYR
jgi:nicotinic acid mononucleotide adenylyltransferase